ncbi:MAG: DUF4982 domain-containing protein, partial [Muribaculaceae bacterium]|nr:DUF4982 domain-containing protein [Muribaculaceae bacterium]
IIVYSNCDEVELRLNNKKIGRSKVFSDSCFVRFPGVKYRRGNLEAIALRNNRPVSRHKLTTAGKPARIEAINAKGNNVDCIELRIVDKHGTIVPKFDGSINLSTEGCEIVGIDNGNQYDPDGLKYTSFSKGSFHNGKIRLYIRHDGNHSGKYFVKTDKIGNFSFNL